MHRRRVALMVILPLIFSIFLNGCRRDLADQSLHKPYAVKIDFDSLRPMKASEIFEEPEFIFLRTPDSLLLADIAQIIISDRNIIVLESSSPFGRLFIFNRSGEYLYDSGPKGNGPGEFRGAKGIALNKDEDNITFQELTGKPGLVTQTLDGEVIDYKDYKSTRIAHGGYSIMQDYNSGFFAVSLEFIGDLDKDKLLRVKLGIYDAEKEIIYPAIIDPIEFTLPLAIIDYNQLYRYDGNLFFKATTWDTIYKIVGSDAIPEYYLDFGKHSLPPELHFAKNASDYFKLRSSNPVAAFIHYYWTETERYYAGAFRVRGSGDILYIRDKVSCETFSFNSFCNDWIWENEYSSLSNIPRMAICDTLVIIHEPLDLISRLNSYKERLSTSEFDKYHQSNSHLIEQVERLSINDNPVIGLYPIRKK